MESLIKVLRIQEERYKKNGGRVQR